MRTTVGQLRRAIREAFSYAATHDDAPAATNGWWMYLNGEVWRDFRSEAQARAAAESHLSYMPDDVVEIGRSGGPRERIGT